MALLNQLDAAATRTALNGWLGRILPEAGRIEVTDVHVPHSSGMSMTTILFKATLEHGEEQELDLAARVAPQRESLFKSPDLGREFRIIAALHEHTDVPVPTPRWHETDPAVLGAEFLVFDRANGRAPADDPPFTVTGWVLDLTPKERERMHRNALEVLAGVHAADPTSLGLRFLDDSRFGPTGLEQQIARWYDFYEWVASGGSSPTIETGFDWVRENRSSEDEEIVLNWGDPRVGNCLFATDGSVAAALDWEMATLASPQTDLAWWLFMQRHHTEGIGAPLPDGIPDRDATIAIYEELAGRTVADMEFHEAFAALRSAVLMVRIGSLMIAGGALPDGHPMPYANPASTLLAELIGIPAPEGATQSFLGDRG